MRAAAGAGAPSASRPSWRAPGAGALDRRCPHESRRHGDDGRRAEELAPGLDLGFDRGAQGRLGQRPARQDRGIGPARLQRRRQGLGPAQPGLGEPGFDRGVALRARAQAVGPVVRQAVELQREDAGPLAVDERVQDIGLPRLGERGRDVAALCARGIAVQGLEDHADRHHDRFAARIARGGEDLAQPMQGRRLLQRPGAPVVALQDRDGRAEDGLPPQGAQRPPEGREHQCPQPREAGDRHRQSRHDHQTPP